MMQFSIRDVLLLMLVVACAAGWWRDHADGAAERQKLSKEMKEAKLSRDYGSWRYVKLYEAQVALGNSEKALLQKEKALLETKQSLLEDENNRLEVENAQLRRRLLNHSMQLDVLQERFKRRPPDS